MDRLTPGRCRWQRSWSAADVRTMRLDGTSLKDTAAQCEMLRTTVIAAVKAYEAGGWKAARVKAVVASVTQLSAGYVERWQAG